MSTRNTHFYGEPYYLEDGNVIKDRDGMWIADVKDSEWAERLVETINLLAPHPDLSAVEVHSKETMDEVRKCLSIMVEDVESEGIYDSIAHAALAKLNPPQ